MKHTETYPILDPLVILVGPTGIGKTALSIRLAKQYDFEIISVDSMQVYRYMDIGTAKISEEEMESIPHHLINVVDPDEPFDASLYEKLALHAVQDILSRGKRVLLTGGTGLYLRALLTGLSQRLPHFPDIRDKIHGQLVAQGPQVLHDHLSSIDRISAKRIHLNDTQRLVRAIEIYQGTGKSWSEHLEQHKKENVVRFPNTLTIGLTCDREELYQRIEQRSHIMLNSGLQAEVQGLLNRGYGKELKPMQAIGYKHMVKYLQGEWDYPAMAQYLMRDTRRYAKRQFTWFNAMKGLHWLERTQGGEVGQLVGSFLKSFNSARYNDSLETTLIK